jgi:hypothetical protein
LRASWAQVGGDFDPYNLNLNYELISGGHRNMILGTIANNSNPNKFLVPLTSTELEAGFEIGLFNNRLTTDVSIYQQETTDDIIPVSIPNASGYSSTWINVGKIQNKGFEILLTIRPVQRAVLWDIQINYAQNHNEVIKISDETYRIRPDWYYGTSRTFDAFIEFWEGHPFSSIVGFKQDTINGNGVIDANTGFPVRKDSLVILGNGVHPYVGGVTNTFSFKGWTLGFLVDFKFGADIYSGTNHQMTRQGLHKQTLLGKTGRKYGLLSSGVDRTGEPVDVWIPPDELESYWSNYSRISEHYIYDASFVKLRQVIFGYSFPARILNKTPFSYLNLSFVGRNLLLLYSNTENLDPESFYNTSNYQGLEYFSIPSTRSYGFNLQVRF